MDNNILDYDNMVYKIANRYKNIVEFDDLVQVGRIGLCKAYRNYNCDFDNKFSTYAYKCILGEILNYIRNSKTIKISRELQSLYNLINKTKDKLTIKLGKNITNFEIASFLEIDEKLVDDAIIANEYIKSLDYSLNNDDEDKEVNLYDMYGYEEKGYDPSFLDLKNEIYNLTDEEQKLIYYRYYKDLSQQEVGNILNTNQVSVSRRETKILKKLNSRLTV